MNLPTTMYHARRTVGIRTTLLTDSGTVEVTLPSQKSATLCADSANSLFHGLGLKKDTPSERFLEYCSEYLLY